MGVLADISSSLPDDALERPGCSPDKSRVRGCFHRRDWWIDDAGRRVWGEPIYCDSCGRSPSELLALTSDFRICFVCREVVLEAHNLRHSGEYQDYWRDRNSQSTSRDARISDPPTTKQRMRVFRRDDFKCRYCGEGGGDLTVDHVVPGGGRDPENLVTACRSCNSRKGSRTPDEAGMELD